ncbi:MAG: FkbM family methyltransferase [Terracidiphilus sp.]
MIQKLLRLARVTKYLPYFRGIFLLKCFYRAVLPHRDLHLSVDDFDGDLKLEELDVRDTMGVNIWHRPDFFDKNQRALFCGQIGPGSTVLDVGANVGVYTLLAAKRGARVFAIEADPRNVELLRRHVRINGFEDRVTIFPTAVGDREGTVSLFRLEGNCGHSNLFAGTDPVQVPCRTIDSLNLPPIQVCKMDIEGGEMKALLGMQATIQNSPTMKMLIEYAECWGATEGMLEFIRGRFRSLHAVRRAPLWPTGPLRADMKIPPFCDLWALRSHSMFDSAPCRSHTAKWHFPQENAASNTAVTSTSGSKML